MKVGGGCNALIRSIIDEVVMSVSAFTFLGGSCDVLIVLSYGGVVLLVVSGGRSSPNS